MNITKRLAQIIERLTPIEVGPLALSARTFDTATIHPTLHRLYGNCDRPECELNQ